MVAARGSAIRARFAPSPTGHLHIGSARTALFNWLLARHEGGKMLLRVEDTDAERSTREFVDLIFSTLEWLGLDYDGEPVFQSRNAERHIEAVQQLVAFGHAYCCDCTREEVDGRAAARGGPPGYDGHCRDRDVQPGPNTVVRFRTPDEGMTVVHDIIRGDVSFPNETLEDFVIVRSTGAPMFLVANAVDDLDMGITHILRGEDLLSSTPKALLLRTALGSPGDDLAFAHLPLIVNQQGKKFSKRDGAVAVDDYRSRGYLPDAFVNYLATLGWGAPDGVELRPTSEIVELFDVASISKSPAQFDLKKLRNFNGDYIRRLPLDEYKALTRPYLDDVFDAMAPLLQERVKALTEGPAMIDFLFTDDGELAFDDKSWTKVMVNGKDLAVAMLDIAIDGFETLAPWTAEAVNDVVIGYADDHEIPRGKAQAPVRVAITGRSVGPPLWEAIELLGRERTLARLRRVRERIS
ncbi:MAG: glutamate--tRNA ligase [Actinobacteria bacterium]|nr:glutamate--tRNA ligase [Actinomycetota bacterium]